MTHAPITEPVELTLRIVPGIGPGEMKLKVSPGYVAELLELVRAEGLDASLGAEFSAGPALDIVSVIAGGGAGLTAIAAAVKTFLTRHKDKHVRFGAAGEVLETKGLSARDIERIMAVAANAQRLQEQAMTRNGVVARKDDTGPGGPR